MHVHVMKNKDFVAGLLFLLFGLASIWGSSFYALGTAMRMGPGYFPLALGGILTVLGLAVIAQSVHIVARGDTSRQIERPRLRSLLLIGAAMLIFAAALKTVGLIVATVGLVTVSGIAYHAFCWKEIGLLSGGLAAFAVVVFAYGLGLPLQVLPA